MTARISYFFDISSKFSIVHNKIYINVTKRSEVRNRSYTDAQTKLIVSKKKLIKTARYHITANRHHNSQTFLSRELCRKK